MRALDETGLAQNTIFVFTSDNGADWTPGDRTKFPEHHANGSWRGLKRDIYDGGHRIPFLVRWPGKIRPGMVSDSLGCLTDLLATAADIVGADVPAGAGEDSISLLPALLDRKSSKARSAIVHHSMEGMFAIRQGSWKLVLGLGSGGSSKPVRIEPAAGEPAGQLFNLAKDPAESHDVYSQHPEIVTQLTALMTKYQSQGQSRS
jgi:arylsulfatase A-like enzyme